MTNIFCFQKLFSGYEGKQVLDNLSGSIEKGKITALIGPNGSGKSTLLNVLGGFHPYTGNVKLKNKEVRDIKRRDFGRLLGMLAQHTNIKSPFSVYDVIAFGRLPHYGLLSRMNEQDDKIIVEAAKKTEISHLLFRRITDLSGGERQRVLFSMVLAQDPEIYLLDEPTSSLDPNQTIKIFSILRAIANQGKTVLLAAHDINMSIPFSDNFIALKNGAILSQGASCSLNEKTLERLYETTFTSYISEKGDIAWHPLVK